MDDLLWRVEEACHDAYPAPETVMGGWLLRHAGGRSRRANSVNPLRQGPRDPSAIVRGAEALYAGRGRTAQFRVPDFAVEMDAALDRFGYGRSGDYRTLWADADTLPRLAPAAVRCTATPDAAWLGAWATVNVGVSPADIASFTASVAALALPAVFAASVVCDDAAAVAYGALDRDILVVEAVATHPARRRQGHARATLAALFAWAVTEGARGACLQVVADNEAALALYRASGFTRDLYGYHYRDAPRPAPDP